MTIGVLGGLLLILASWFVTTGKIYTSTIIFFIADLCWVTLSIQSGDFMGASFIFIGMSLGIVAFYKMHTGKMLKDLNRGSKS